MKARKTDVEIQRLDDTVSQSSSMVSCDTSARWSNAGAAPTFC
jgi:hypothetical protein